MPAVVQKARMPFNRQSGNVVRHFDFGNRSQVVVVIDSDDIEVRVPVFTGIETLRRKFHVYRVGISVAFLASETIPIISPVHQKCEPPDQVCPNQIWPRFRQSFNREHFGTIWPESQQENCEQDGDPRCAPDNSGFGTVSWRFISVHLVAEPATVSGTVLCNN